MLFSRPIPLGTFGSGVDEPIWNRYGIDMAEYTLKNIPQELHERLKSAAAENFRSLNQEILSRVSRSFDAEDAKVSALHARWVHEALSSGEAKPLEPGELDEAFGKGIERARKRLKAGEENNKVTK